VCRYIVIVHPMKAKSWCTMTSTYRMIAAVWTASVLLSLPTLYIMVHNPFAYLLSRSPPPPRKTQSCSQCRFFVSKIFLTVGLLVGFFIAFKRSFLVRDAFVVDRTNRRTIAMMFVRLSVCLSVRPSVREGRASWSYGAL